MLIMKSGKREITERTEQQSQKSISMFEEKENYEYLEILQADTIKPTEI